jgi:hypothetical protein
VYLKTGLLLIFLMATFLLVGVQLIAQDEQNENGQCCFVNPNYQGVCAVSPADGESCEEILAYLNTPLSVGKTYCENSRIRGGWERVNCPEEEDNPPSVSLPAPW